MTEYGLQLYSVRDITKDNLDEALCKVAELGYKYVEFAGFFGNSAEDVKAMLDKYSLKVSGTHSPWTDLKPAAINDTIAYHKAIGNRYYIVPGADLSTLEKIEEFVAVMNYAQPILAAEGIKARVVNIHTIKPIDRDILAKAVAETGAIVTAEEHNIIGGLGAAVAEVVCETAPAPVVRVGMNDTYGHSGTVPALLEAYGLTPANIVTAAKKAISMKK